jgi:spore germination cell wall hydrolase CwlJ-like protein
MTAFRPWPRGAIAPFGLAGFIFVLTPGGIGYQDLSSAVAAEPVSTRHWRQFMVASPFGTIDAANFSLPRPLGSTFAEPAAIQLASLTSDTFGVMSDAPDNRFTRSGLVYPSVDRKAKGDFQGAPAGGEPYSIESASTVPNEPVGTAEPQAPASADDEIEAAVRFEPFPEYDISLSLELHPQIRPDEAFASAEESQPDISLLAMANDPDPSDRNKRVFFGSDLIGSSLAGIIPWANGEEPIVMFPRAPSDPDIKQAALSPSDTGIGQRDGESIAGKGEVTSEGRRPKTPAERLKLDGKTREKAEKCLANAVYFESRGEAVRGQIAVAQVVMNRVFSGYYPGDVCGVVYQNAHRHLACQFTFACDSIPDVVTEPEPWERAKRIAKATLDGKVWLPEIGKATHYHAYWVRPRWVREMRKLHKVGVHTFYRPRYWGDGSDEPTWGTAASTQEAAAKM